MNYKSRAKAFYSISIILTLLSILFLTLSFVFSFDELNGYFEDGILPILFWIVFILGMAAPIVSALLLSKNEIIKTDDDIGKSKTGYAIFAGLLALFAIIFKIFSMSSYSTTAILGACSFMLYLVLCVSSGHQYNWLKALSLLLSIIFPLATNTENTLVLERHSNSIENLLTSIFVISFLLYILYEGKRIFTGVHSRWHMASMILASHTGLSISIAYVIAYGFEAVNEITRLPQIAFILIISLFIQFELFEFIRRSEAHTKEERDALEAPDEVITEESEEATEETINE